MNELSTLSQAFFASLWNMTLEMAPWLLFGYAVAGLLRIFLPSDLASRHLASGDRWASLKAALLGMPMPLCSCSVIPVTAHLRKSGAGTKASLSFLTATPTNGLDSMFPTLAMLGPGFMVLRPIFAFVSGLGAGWVVPDDKENTCASKTNAPQLPFADRLRNGIEYAFVDLVRDTRKWLLIGLALGALIDVTLPSTWLGSLDSPWLAYGIVMLIAIPMYVCSTGSLPIAAALMGKGLSAGAAFLFITLGPATSTATIAFVFGTFGRKIGFRWLGSMAILALTTAIVIDYALPLDWFASNTVHHHHEHEQSLWGALGAIAFVLLLFRSLIKDFSWSKSHHHTPSNQEQTMQHQFNVPDMSCGNCARSIENRLGDIGARLVTKDLASKDIVIESDRSSAEIGELLTKAGFPPKNSTQV